MAAAAAALFRPQSGTQSYALLQTVALAQQDLTKMDLLTRAKQYTDGVSIDPIGEETRRADGSYALTDGMS